MAVARHIHITFTSTFLFSYIKIHANFLCLRIAKPTKAGRGKKHNIIQEEDIKKRKENKKKEKRKLDLHKRYGDERKSLQYNVTKLQACFTFFVILPNLLTKLGMSTYRF